jgi:nucleoside phosphorylase
MEGHLMLVVAALELELAGIRRTMKTANVVRMGEALCEAGWIGEQACLLVQCGMGRQRAEQTLRLVLAQHQPSVILSLGFCGALAATLRPGDLVVCSPLRGLHTMEPLLHAAPVDRVLSCDEALVRQARLVSIPQSPGLTRWFKPSQWGYPVEGECLTLPSAASHRSTKAWLSEHFASVVVDMESFWLGALAQEAGIPFLAVRAVSDTHVETLPPFEGLVDDFGQAEWPALSSYLAHHPLVAGQLVRFGLHARQAQKSLTKFAIQFLRHSGR